MGSSAPKAGQLVTDAPLPSPCALPRERDPPGIPQGTNALGSAGVVALRTCQATAAFLEKHVRSDSFGDRHTKVHRFCHWRVPQNQPQERTEPGGSGQPRAGGSDGNPAVVGKTTAGENLPGWR